MTRNKLKFSIDKNDMIVLSAAYRPRPPIDFLTFSDFDIPLSSTARNIGVVFDEKLSLENHITSICKSSFFTYKIYGKFVNISVLELVKLLFTH